MWDVIKPIDKQSEEVYFGIAVTAYQKCHARFGAQAWNQPLQQARLKRALGHALLLGDY